MRRRLRDEERALLLALVEHEPEFRGTYVGQINATTEVEDWSDKNGSITLTAGSGAFNARVQAIADNGDGGEVEIILWGDASGIRDLEFVFAPGMLKQYPAPKDLKDVWDHKGNPRPQGW